MLADKSSAASVDGLNQLFFIDSSEKKAKVTVSPKASLEAVGKPILKKVTVDEEVEVAWGMKFDGEKSFAEQVTYLSQVCSEKMFSKPIIGTNCKSCEFRISESLKRNGLKSGFEKCWAETAKSMKFHVDEPLVFDIWNFRKAAKLIEEGVYAARDISEDDVSPTSKNDEPGLSNSERQWIQIGKIKSGDETPYFDYEGMAREMKSWEFPLHFIDFETTMVAIPFNKGRRPYEQTAFQFSHHVVEKDGSVIHKTEYINSIKGKFPNFDFVRALKDALSQDRGTIFRFAIHENTVLAQVREQLLDSHEADRDTLIHFIESVTRPPEEAPSSWKGEREMVDMCELVKKYFYHPYTKGSNSIKKVLPAVLNESTFLKEKYAQPIYGSARGIKSKNFKDWAWIQIGADGCVVDPYKLLPPIFSDLDLETMDSLVVEGSIADGGAAMTAYARMQFTEMSDAEAKRVSDALLKYCELDTFAMVLIYQYWDHEIKSVFKDASVA